MAKKKPKQHQTFFADGTPVPRSTPISSLGKFNLLGGKTNQFDKGAGDVNAPAEEVPTNMSNIQKLYMAGGVLSTASIALGARSAASAIRMRGKFEEAAFIENARRLKKAAKDAVDRGETDVANYLHSLRKLEGAQTAALAAQGIDVSRGSAKAIREETTDQGYDDIATIRTNAIREAFGHKKQALEQERSAKLTRIGRKSEEKQKNILARTNMAQAVVGTGIKMNKAGGK